MICDSSFLETHTSNSTWMGALFVTHIILAMVVFLGIHQGVGFLPFSKVVVLCLILMSTFKLYLMVSRSNLDSWLQRYNLWIWFYLRNQNYQRGSFTYPLICCDCWSHYILEKFTLQVNCDVFGVRISTAPYIMYYPLASERRDHCILFIYTSGWWTLHICLNDLFTTLMLVN